MRRVNPDDLEASFGEGYNLNSITLEITDEEISKEGIELFFPWLNEYYSRRLDGNRFGTVSTNNKFANSLSSGAFKAGNRK